MRRLARIADCGNVFSIGELETRTAARIYVFTYCVPRISRRKWVYRPDDYLAFFEAKHHAQDHQPVSRR